MHDDDSSQALTRRRFLRLSATGAALSTAAVAPRPSPATPAPGR